MDRVRSGYIIKSASRLRNKDKIPVNDLRKRVLLRNFLRHQIGIQPHSLFDLREKKKENKKDAAAIVDKKTKRVALKSLPSTVVHPMQGTSSSSSSSSNSVLNDVQVNRVSSSSSFDADLQCSVVSSSDAVETDQVGSIVHLQSQTKENDLISTPNDHPRVSLIEDNNNNEKDEETHTSSARVEKMKSYNGPWMWRRKLGLNFIRKKFRSFMKVCAKRQALCASKKSKKIFIRPIKLKLVSGFTPSKAAVPDSTDKKDQEVPKFELSISTAIAISPPNSSGGEIDKEQESVHKESKTLTKELDYYISLYESKTRAAASTRIKKQKSLSLSKKKLSKRAKNDENSSPCSKTDTMVVNMSAMTDDDGKNILHRIIKNVKSGFKLHVRNGKLTTRRSAVIKAFRKENRKWYERRQYRSLKKCYTPGCGNDNFTVEQHIKHKCLPSCVSFLPYTKYMKASEYFLYLHDSDGVSNACVEHDDSDDL